uniref:Uncharacterized protein n=1 Tax=Anguilla anguilla TaxID=7936 RepID=A0A0E9R4F6_ANGAN
MILSLDIHARLHYGGSYSSIKVISV